jgi:nucleotide-binding universal stress UspA family protein
VRSILTTSSGSPSSSDAMLATAAIAARTGAAVHLFTVYEPNGVVSSRWSTEVEDIELDTAGRKEAEQFERRIREHAASLGEPISSWPVRVAVGPSAQMIASAAREVGADMIVVGLGRPEVSFRQMGTEMALRLGFLSSVPVLAVAPDPVVPFERLVVDASTEDSLRAMRTALPLLREGGVVDLVEVRSTASSVPSSDESDRLQLLLHLGRENASHVRHVLIEGEPGAQLVSYASQVRSDLVVTPLVGETSIDRTLARNVAVTLFRAASCSVLAVPIARAEPRRTQAGSLLAR